MGRATWIHLVVAVGSVLAVGSASGQASPQEGPVVPPREVAGIARDVNEPQVEPTVANAPVTPAAQTVRDQASSQGTRVPVPPEVMGVKPESGRTEEASTGRDNGVMQVAELIQHIAVIIASAVASAVAIFGLTTWRRELKGKHDMELAEEVLCLFYRAERAIEAIRSRWGDLREEQTREAQANETPEQKEARDRAYVVFKKIQDHGEIFNQLHTLRFRFMARFGRDKAKSFDEMKHVISMIEVSAESLARLWADQLRRGDRVSEGTRAEIQSHHQVIWSMGKADQITSDVKRIVAEIEAVCRPIIDGQVSWVSRLWTRAFGGKEATRS